MRYGPIGAAVLTILLLGSSAWPQQQKKPKSPLSSGIDSNAAGVGGGGKQSPLADDGEFLRRVMLDLVGYPPSLEQVKAFMADTNVDKPIGDIRDALRTRQVEESLNNLSQASSRLFYEVFFYG